ncbi:hypothetical protein FN976_00730 [Caenimonas sedimenti]|uniref:Uncharacterized protein n=1 Tax=Caenimonas sedimenti TaxID=2596921 RepID=A0A562ZY33_9BURK|nr:hypothetical protein [Caenimonas sedimenti]TWO73403.1 hypothetical protein FN976_00730 [Caenimonas sedimenti]
MLKHLVVASALALACGVSVGQPADPSALLAELAKTLSDVRANPAAASRARCPANLSTLAGLPVGRVIIELGQPPQSSSDNALRYPIAGGQATGARAGELAFKFDGKGNVSAVECRQAK